MPWDTPDASEFGHGEPAMLLRLLDLARHTGFKLHFFVSNRVIRAFPTHPEAVLNDGHDLDWLSKHPAQLGERFQEAMESFRQLGHAPTGIALKEGWTEPTSPVPGWDVIRFVSSPEGSIPEGLRHYPVTTRTARDAARSGITARSWTDSVRNQMREAASRGRGVTAVVRPQVLARFDPRLAHVRELLEFALAVDLPVLTLRGVEAGG